MVLTALGASFMLSIVLRRNWILWRAAVAMPTAEAATARTSAIAETMYRIENQMRQVPIIGDIMQIYTIGALSTPELRGSGLAYGDGGG